MEEVEESLPPPAEPSPAPQQKRSEEEKRPPSNEDRKKWDAAELPVLPVAQQTLEETCGTTTSESWLPEEKTLKSSILTEVTFTRLNCYYFVYMLVHL